MRLKWNSLTENEGLMIAEAVKRSRRTVTICLEKADYFFHGLVLYSA
jgi:hypothetical protein